MLPAISRRGETCQFVEVDRSGARLVPNVAGPPRPSVRPVPRKDSQFARLSVFGPAESALGWDA
jgi:hypothetical protein